MSERENPCAALRPLFFAAIDGEVDRAVRLEVHAHLAICAACRSWEASERSLTTLLTESRPARSDAAPRRARSRLPAFVGSLAIAAAVLLVLPSATPRGSLVERHLGPGVTWQVTGERALDGNEVVNVPAAAAATVRLGDGVQLDAVGPARFVLDGSGRRWRVVVRTGTVSAMIAADSTLAVGPDASQHLGTGNWLLTTAHVTRLLPEPSPESAPQDPVSRDTASLLADGLARFGSANGSFTRSPAEREHLAACERLLRAVVAAKDVTTEQERRASFYLAASVSRQGREMESFALYEQWLTRHPDGAEASLVRFHMAAHLREQGRSQEARTLFERVQGDEGETSLGKAARLHLEMMQGNGAGPRQQPPEDEAESLTVTRAPANDPAPGAGGYLVVAVDLDAARDGDAGYLAAAQAARAFHRGERLAWDGADFALLAAELRQRAPESVLFVLRPGQLDLVLHRRILLLAAAIDDDWFADFAFGYLTAESGDGCQQLWRRIATVHERGPLRGGEWCQASVTSNPTSLEYENAPPPLAAEAGFRGPHYYFSTANGDREAVITRALEAMRSAEVVEITGCGDPQGIWLFNDQRNLQRERHWQYAPERVGQDPDSSMPRLLASRFRTLELQSPILWSGTCHSGAVCRVFVEGDIVSTFGRTERATVHRLAPNDSLALSWLAAGAAGLLVPLGANHGMSVSMEVDFALRHGASLGETIKSTYDDVLLAAKGALVLDLPVEGQAHESREAVMQGGGSNRILIGDPALRPFRAVNGSAEVVTVEPTPAGHRVTVKRAAGWQPRAWDMFGTARDRDWRVLARVDIGGPESSGRTEFTARVTARTPDGAPLPYTIGRVGVEDHRGTRYLHLQANGPRGPLDGKACTVVFEVAAK